MNSKKLYGFFAILAVIVFTTFITSACDNGNSDNGNTPDTNITQSVAKPTATPAGGNYTAVQTVSLATATPNAEIYYTLNGTNPTVNSTKYSSVITISAATTLKAIAVKSGMNDSEILTESYTINLPVQPAQVVRPVATPAGGNYTSAQSVTLATTTPDAAIFYTINGSNPTTGSSFYSSAISINSTTTLKAVAVKTGMADSEILTETYTIGSTTIIPNTPTDVSATAENNSIIITWTMASSGGIPTSYNVWRSTSSSGTYTEIGNVLGTVTSYTDTGLSANTYYYRVDAQNSAGRSSQSSPVSAAIEDFPGTPRSVTATAQSMSSIRITWNAPSSGGTPSSYYIWRSTSSIGTYTEIGNVSGTTTSYIDTGLSASTTYYYKVDARNSAGRSAQSTWDSATTDANPLLPNAPTNVSVTALTPGSVRITWNAPSSGVVPTFYNIWRSTTYGGTYTEVGYVSGSTTSWINTGLSDNSIYYYRVDAENSLGRSPQSPQNGVSVLTPIIRNTLTNGVWQTTSTLFNETIGDWYSFTVTSGTTYRIWVDDTDNSSGSRTADVTIMAYYSNGTQIWTSQQDNNWSTPASFIASSSGTVYIKADPYSSSTTGTFRIVYSTGTTRP